jgi:valyl-tRNA synthetase
MDEGLSEAVREVFVRLYNEGLIYKGDYIINWCPRCRTALSDLEVEHEEESAKLYHLAYPLESGRGSIIVVTTRPETMLGDTAVAVHPKDDRYLDLIGEKVILPVLHREIPIIGDEYVDMEFGSGALKVTPAHDLNDFEIGLAHELEMVKVIDEDGRMGKEAGTYQTMVCENETACRGGLSGSEDWQNEDHSTGLGEDLLRMDEQHSGLVYFKTDLVGASDSRVVLRGVRGNHSFEGGTPLL